MLDDHEVVRRGVRDLLEAEDDFEVVGEAGTAEEARRRIPATSPDVAPSRSSSVSAPSPFGARSFIVVSSRQRLR